MQPRSQGSLLPVPIREKNDVYEAKNVNKDSPIGRHLPVFGEKTCVLLLGFYCSLL